MMIPIPFVGASMCTVNRLTTHHVSPCYANLVQHLQWGRRIHI